MKCPRDGSELARVHIGDVELDKCHQCDGIWCDRGELERIRELQLSQPEEQLERQYGNPEPRTGETSGYMKCPRCGGRLQGVFYMLGSSIRIDRCEDCFGFWLDDGELDGLASRRPEATSKSLKSEEESGNLPTMLRSIAKWFQTS